MQTDLLLNNFATRCFRDVADHDYIAARLSYRASLFSQFHWSALQAIEKYLKAILLFNRIKATKLSHNLSRALVLTKELPFQIELSDSSYKFIEHLDTYGRFRYLETSYFLYGPKLVELDKTVWELRRYCKVLNYELPLPNGKHKNMLSEELKLIQNSNNVSPQKFILNSGLLEAILNNKTHPARKPLIWQNGFYGSSSRKYVKMHIPFHATNSPFTLNPQLIDIVKEYIFIPKEVIAAYKEN